MKPDKFLSNPDQLHYQIHCVECKSPLWNTKILKRDGSRVVSTETLSCAPNVPVFNRYLENCPLCGKRFYAMTKKGQSYLIKDLESGLQRLI